MVASSVTMETIYRELKMLKKDIETVKFALIPEERVSPKEMKAILKIKKEMECGKEKGVKDIFA